MSELKSQIDYSKLEWFDCESNFPPMYINLYVDSEHGFGIGRLGKRVKDGSTIWTVHLDSGEVYLVYAFYKVKRWAYMEEEKTNTKLKTHDFPVDHGDFTTTIIANKGGKIMAEEKIIIVPKARPAVDFASNLLVIPKNDFDEYVKEIDKHHVEFIRSLEMSWDATADGRAREAVKMAKEHYEKIIAEKDKQIAGLNVKLNQGGRHEIEEN